jgi:hypothetical protein
VFLVLVRVFVNEEKSFGFTFRTVKTMHCTIGPVGRDPYVPAIRSEKEEITRSSTYILKKMATRPVAIFWLVKDKKLPTIASAAASVSSISTATIAPFHRLSLVNREGSPSKFSAVQCLDGLLRLTS